MKKSVLFLLLQFAFAVFFNYQVFSQGVAINNSGTDPDPSAMLDVASTNSGILIPRMSQAQRDAISNPATGLMIYQTDNNPGFYYNSGTPLFPVWVRISLSQETVGGTGTATRVAFWSGTNTLGSNANLFWDNTNSRLGIGTASPMNRLDVAFTGADRVARIRNLNNAANSHGVLISTTRNINDAYILNLDANGTSRMYVRSDGNIGIGTTTPSAQLHTTGTIRFGNYSSGFFGAFLRTNASGDLGITNFTGNSGDVLLGDGNFGSFNNIAWGTTGNSGTNPSNNFIGTTDNTDFVIRTNNTEAIRINNTGRFYFNSPVSNHIDFRIRAIGGTISPDDYILKVEDSNGDLVFCVTRDGNVGIKQYPGGLPSVNFRTLGTIRFDTYASGINGAILRTNNFGVLEITNFTGNSGDVLLGDGNFGSFNNIAWRTTGNSGTNPSNNFIGTTDNTDFVIRSNNTERMRVLNSGAIRIGYGSGATDALQISGYGSVNPRLFFGAEGGAPGYGIIRIQNQSGTDNIVLRGNNTTYFNTGSQYYFGTNTTYGVSDVISAVANPSFTDPLNAYTIYDGAVGIYGQSIGYDGTGVIGYAPAGSLATGIYGSSSSGTGVYGQTNGNNGWSVAGEATHATGTAGFFANTATNDNSSQGFAIDARNNQTAGATIKANLGGTGASYYSNTSISAFTDASISNGIGIIAVCNNTTGIGVQGQSTGANGIGVFGVTNGSNALGVYGFNQATGNTAAWGVYGRNSGTGVGVYGSANEAPLYVAPNNAGSGGAFSANRYGAYATQELTNFGNGYTYTGTYAGLLADASDGQYHFGVHGHSFGTATINGRRTGGVLGSHSQLQWGALGYRTSGNSNIGVYGSTAYNSGWGKSSNNVWNGIGVAGFGSLFGSVFRGQIYGMAVKGERYAIYVDGKQITNDVITQVQTVPQSETRIATYVPTSTNVDIFDRGVAKMTNGKITIKFKKEFTDLVSEEEPIIVTVSPMGRPAVLYLHEVTSTEFTVIDDSENSQKDLTFSWIAVGVRKGYENPLIPEEILSKEFDSRLDTYLHNDSDTQNDGTPMWWDGSQLRFDTPPASETEIKEEDNDLKSLKSERVALQSAEIKSLHEERTVISGELKTTTANKLEGISNKGKELIQRKAVNLSPEVEEK